MAETVEVKFQGNKIRHVSQHYITIDRKGGGRELEFLYIVYQPYCLRPVTSQDITDSTWG